MTWTRNAFALAYVASTLLAGAALWAFWGFQGRTQPLPESGASGRLECVSYSPFAKDQSPLDPNVRLSPAQIDADLALLARRFSCVRTYSMTGLESVPALARLHGLQVLLGAWVGPDPVATRREIDLLVTAANRYPEVVSGVIVGNEVLLRKDLPAPRLAALIREVNGKVHQPVSYADVWEFWLDNPMLAADVDVITIHLLPYWEDEPAGVDAALDRVAEARGAVAARFPGRDILIGETGWPTEGRQRETAQPGRVAAASFLRGVVAMATREGWRYNLIEAFDQPWKRASEGMVGGYWGLFDADRRDKGLLAGPVSDLPDWRRWLAASAALAVAAMALAGSPRRWRDLLTRPLLAAAGALALTLWWRLGLLGNRNGWEWLWTALVMALTVLTLARALLAPGGGGWRGALSAALDRGAWVLVLASGFVAAAMALQLAVDPRYRVFPSPVVAALALCWLYRPAPAPPRETALLLGVIALCIPLQLWRETLANTQALGWAGASGLMALALGRSLRTSRSAAASNANTPGVTV